MRAVLVAAVMSAPALRTVGPTGGSVFSHDRVYRYRLWRHLSASARRALFVMLNPSKADHHDADPTWTRCIGFAKRESCGRVDAVNTRAFVDSDPAIMRAAADPIGPLNENYVREALGELQRGDLLIAAWGASANVTDAVAFTAMLRNRGVDVMCFGVCRNGMPRHPLFVRADAPLVRYA